MPLPLPAQNVPCDCIKIYTSSAGTAQLVTAQGERPVTRRAGRGKVKFFPPQKCTTAFPHSARPIHTSLIISDTQKAMQTQTKRNVL